jgi:hypothetical protein
MARTIIPRNAIGQYTGHVPVDIQNKCHELAAELFAAFPDVDIWDIENIASRAFAYEASMTLLRECETPKKIEV